MAFPMGVHKKMKLQQKVVYAAFVFGSREACVLHLLCIIQAL
jgi:hypothetical protein